MSDQDPRTDAHTEDSAGTSGGPRRESREISGAFEAENRSPVTRTR